MWQKEAGPLRNGTALRKCSKRQLNTPAIGRAGSPETGLFGHLGVDGDQFGLLVLVLSVGDEDAEDLFLALIQDLVARLVEILGDLLRSRRNLVVDLSHDAGELRVDRAADVSGDSSRRVAVQRCPTGQDREPDPGRRPGRWS